MKHESEILIDGQPYTVVTDDLYMSHMEGIFEPDTTRILACMARGVILDVGANIGLTTLLHSRIAEHVHAFEPSPTTFQLLRENLERADRQNVTLHNVGLGEQAGTFELTFAPQNRSGAFVSDQTQASVGHTIERIQIETLDEVVRRSHMPKIDMIKIDVEGFELQVLRGGGKSLSRNKPAVVLEMNHWCLNAFRRTSIPDFMDALVALFPIVLAVQQDHHRDLRDPSSRYTVMHRHINMFWYQTLVCAFEPEQVSDLIEAFPLHEGG
ncbi:FkbM family methyltransferase [Stenotrophomonas sp. 278]|uniref:FkbM family methyltransferase n=1 Tax=Stenotrophomonas sp. 278 TaxID=2479851 RepID=UPI001C8BF203|nr:FkbM family methyltransferase [Stenotrophomonas sp. 278]